MKTLLWINVNVVVIYEAISAIFLVRSFRNIKLTCCIVNIKYVQEYLKKKKIMIIIIIFSSLWLFGWPGILFFLPLDSPVLLFDMTFDLRLPSYLGGLRHVLSGFLGFSSRKSKSKDERPGSLAVAGPKAIGLPEWSRASKSPSTPAGSSSSSSSLFSWMNARASWSKKRNQKNKNLDLCDDELSFLRS